MTNFADVLTVLAAGGGLAVFLVMAAVPLLLDRDRRHDAPGPGGEQEARTRLTVRP
jgi:hypothetical protein